MGEAEAARLARSANPTSMQTRGAAAICGRTDATQSRPYPDWVMAVRGWRMGEAGLLGWHAVPTLPKEEGQHVVLSLPEMQSAEKGVKRGTGI